jgi:hypothetical protein
MTLCLLANIRGINKDVHYFVVGIEGNLDFAVQQSIGSPNFVVVRDFNLIRGHVTPHLQCAQRK